MSTGKRAYDLLRGYVNHGWDLLQGREETAADAELRQAVERPYREPSEAELENVRPVSTPPKPPMDLATARKLLSLDEKASSKQIHAAYDEIAAVVDPKKFPAGSPADLRARDLLARLSEARRILLANIDPTVSRFERLEID